MKTRDGLELNGVLAESGQRSGVKGQNSTLAVLHVHGWEGNFYENRFIDYAAKACNRLGIAFAAFNNRGHDYVADLLRPRSQKPRVKSQEPMQAESDYVQIGGIYEKLEDCVEDIRAAIDFVSKRGHKRIILQGHSHGAIKATHYLSKTRDPRVAGLVLLSPSDDLGWSRRMLGARFPKLLAQARRLVRAGRGRELLADPWFTHPTSAATVLDCFAPDSITGMFNVSRTDRTEFPELAAVRVPVFLGVGTVEEAFVGKPAELVSSVKASLTGVPSFTGTVIKGAPHNYLRHETKLAAALGRWLQETEF